jgi:hypothetical protein
MDFPPINPGLGYFRESFSRDSPDAIDGYVVIDGDSEPYWMPEEFYSPNPNNPPTFPEASIVFVYSGYNDNHPAVSGGYLMDTASAPYQAFGFNAKFIPGPPLMIYLPYRVMSFALEPPYFIQGGFWIRLRTCPMPGPLLGSHLRSCTCLFPLNST